MAEIYKKKKKNRVAFGRTGNKKLEEVDREMSEKIVKYEYEYGLCKRMHYRGLWCVRYEGVPGHFEKAGMACSCAVDGCDKDCAVMESADAVIDPEWEWHMLDNPPGR